MLSRFDLVLLGAGFALALWSAPARAYRTGSDLSELSGTARVRWPTNRIEYVLNEQLPPGHTLRSVQATLEQAFASWQSVPCSLVELRSVGSTRELARQGDGLNTVQWVLEGWEARGFPADAAAVTDVQYAKPADGEWAIAEADLDLNAESKLWVDAPAASNERDLLSVATHEAGHMLGLLHPCEPGGAGGAPDCAADPAFAETTMYPLYDAGQATLSPDDSAGACFLYEGSRCAERGCPEGQACTPEGCRAECAGARCEPGQTCVDGRCETPAPPCVGEECIPASCASDDACPFPMRCVDAACVPGTGAVGDSCASGRDCAAGSCSPQGACLAACALGTECAEGVSCVGNGAGPTCGSEGRPLGDTCDSADDCAGGYCVADLASSPLCSRACGAPNAPGCPAGWNCQQIEARSVCAPLQPEAGSCACETPGESSGSRSLGYPVALAIAGFSVAARRRRRRACLVVSTR